MTEVVVPHYTLLLPFHPVLRFLSFSFLSNTFEINGCRRSKLSGFWNYIGSGYVHNEELAAYLLYCRAAVPDNWLARILALLSFIAPVLVRGAREVLTSQLDYHRALEPGG